MDSLLNNYFDHIDMLFLVLVRISSFLLVAPVFGAKNVPKKTKVGLSLFISIIVFLMLPPQSFIEESTVIGYSVIVIKEIIVGWIIGFCVYLIFTACYFAGQLIDAQIGFSMVNVMDPLSRIQVPITGNLHYYIYLVLFLSLNGHHQLFQALVYSYDTIPIGEAKFNPSLYDAFINAFMMNFYIAVKIASPVLFVLFIVNIALGILVKTAPQMNMFVVGIPLKLLIGLATLIIMTQSVIGIGDNIFNDVYQILFQMIKGLTA